MESRTPERPAEPLDTSAWTSGSAEQQMTQLTDLLSLLNQNHSPTFGFCDAPIATSSENRLVQVRLGIASALFMALRTKDPDSASHSLRVSLDASAWALLLDLSESERNTIEVAGLLHDIGKIGVPDAILFKPGALTADESAMMDRHRQFGLDILRTCCAEPDVLDAVGNMALWYDASRSPDEIAGEQISRAARMLAIVDAYDSMTSDKVYRRAMPRERAMGELFRFAGRQFDPDLVRRFSAFREFDRWKLQQRVARKWLRLLDVAEAHSLWRLNQTAPEQILFQPGELFHTRLLETMHDAAIYVDAGLRIIYWNRAAERLAGVAADSVLHRHWLPSLLAMTNEGGVPLADAECPLAKVLETCEPWSRRVTIRGRLGQPLAVEANIVPVVEANGSTCGAVLTMHDVSSEISLEAKCQNLHELATKDALTNVANRAEFDRVHAEFVEVHLEQRLPCSLIITDIDRFKQVNDIFGHQAGDDVIKSFARLLRSACRPGDLVARYGGEEFVVLCADCDNTVAARRADELRAKLAATVQRALTGRPVTASFGVTAIQPGDTPETMLRRADRALLLAKERGRNTVVQLGTGMGSPEAVEITAQGLMRTIQAFTSQEVEPQPALPLFGRRRMSTAPLVRSTLVATVPLALAVEKLRGFVTDHHAIVDVVEDDHVGLMIDGHASRLLRRHSDRRMTMVVDLWMEEEQVGVLGGMATHSRTRIRAAVRPRRGRDRRQQDAVEIAAQLLASLKAYLMAEEASPLDKRSAATPSADAERN